jgi:putative hydroxymethylpyrimidine transporter CytX
MPGPERRPTGGLTRASTEAPITLADDVPHTLGLLDQLGLWGNLGISLLGFGGALAVQAPTGLPVLPFAGALLAVLVGTALGALALGFSLVMGARTRMPAMVLLRGLLGYRASGLPTVLNIAQCVGWGSFELVVIAEACHSLTHGAIGTWPVIVAIGTLTTILTIRPLGTIYLLRQFVSIFVGIAVLVLAVGLLRRPLPASHGSWTGFWAGVDAALAVAISWVPLGADYARHSRTGRAAFSGGLIGFGCTQVACYGIGLVALAQTGNNPDGVFAVFLSLPLGAAAFGILILRETDQSFANVYSTAVSVQNLRPAWDRRVLTVAVGAITTGIALSMDLDRFVSFLYLIGAVFVPLTGVLLAAWARTGGPGWDTSGTAPTRPAMIAAWAAGFVTYQLINPGAVPGWSTLWARAGSALHLAGHPWLSASITSFAVAAAIAYPLAGRSHARNETPILTTKPLLGEPS